MRAGILILNVFAAIWACAALGSLHAPNWTWLLPVAVSAGLTTACLRRVRVAPVPAQASRRMGYVVGLWSAAEAILIAVAIAAAVRLGAERLIGPLVGIIVGLHFLGLASTLPFRAYYVTGLGLVAVGVAAAVLPVAAPLVVTGFGAALLLWATSLWMGFRSAA
jgi:hypothetical protein